MSVSCWATSPHSSSKVAICAFVSDLDLTKLEGEHSSLIFQCRKSPDLTFHVATDMSSSYNGMSSHSLHLFNLVAAPPSHCAIIPEVETEGGLANISSVMNTDWPVVFTASISVTSSSFGSHWLREQIVIICKLMPQACKLQANQQSESGSRLIHQINSMFWYILQLHWHLLETNAYGSV